jgi:hypothetical protein
MDWEAGLALVRFELAGEGKAEDANLHCPVRLTLRNRDGRSVQKNVTYLVSTNPAVSMFRELFP